MTDIFLSYNRGDQAIAKAIAHNLEAEGYNVWWDTALRAGQTYDEVTEGKLRAARAVVVLWSPRSVKSKWVRAEATMAENRERLVPIMIENCERPLRFELIQTADLVGWTGERDDPRWTDFLEDLHTFVAETAPPPIPASATIAATVVEEEDDEEEDIEPVVVELPRTVAKPVAPEPTPPPVVEPVPVAPPPPPPPPPPPVVETIAAPEPEPPLPRPEQTAATPPTVQPIVAPTPPAAPRPSAYTPSPPPATSSPGMSPMILGAVGIGVVLLLGGIFLQSRGPSAPPATEVAAVAPAPEPAAPVEAPKETARTEEKAAATTSGTFRDCDACPEMARIPAGAFFLGSPDNEPGGKPYERPQQEVPIAAFAMGAAEVTFAQWDACVADGGCGGYAPADKGWGRGDLPVMSVSWRDADAYVKWLSQKTGRAYRLPAESEWEYAARGGARTAYWWGPAYDARRTPLGKTAPVASDEANAFGLHHVSGNVREWVQDCYVSGFSAANRSGVAIESGNCNLRVVRGGGYKDRAPEHRTANRGRNAQNVRDSTVGFRVAAALEK